MSGLNADFDLFEESRAQERIIAEALWGVHPVDKSWGKIVYRQNAIGRMSGEISFIHCGDGVARSFLADEAGNAADELRKLAYRPGVGTWFSMTLTITPEGNGWETTYNFDQEPEWQMGAPGPSEYAVDQYIFPRDEAHLPEWFAKHLPEAEWKPTAKTPPPEELRKYTP